MSTDSIYDPAILREQDTQQKLKMKRHAESRRATREFDIQVGDAVLVKQPKLGKLSTPYHSFPLTVTSKNHGILIVEAPTRKMTRNSSHFKKLLTDASVTAFNATLEEDSDEVDMPTMPTTPPPSAPASYHEPADTGPINTIGCAETLTEVVPPRSARVPKPPKRLIQEI